MPVPYLELHKETKDIKMQVPHGLRHCRINDGEKNGKRSADKTGLVGVLPRSGQLRRLDQQLQVQSLGGEKILPKGTT